MIDLRKMYYHADSTTLVGTNTARITAPSWEVAPGISPVLSKGFDRDAGGMQTSSCERYELATFSEAAGF